MELNLNAEALLFTSSDGISILDGVDSNRFNKKDFTFLCEAIDRIGDASSKVNRHCIITFS